MNNAAWSLGLFVRVQFPLTSPNETRERGAYSMKCFPIWRITDLNIYTVIQQEGGKLPTTPNRTFPVFAEDFVEFFPKNKGCMFFNHFCRWRLYPRLTTRCLFLLYFYSLNSRHTWRVHLRSLLNGDVAMFSVKQSPFRGQVAFILQLHSAEVFFCCGP